MKSLFRPVLLFLFVIFAHEARAVPCVWARCDNQAVNRAPQLCAEHLRCRTKPEGARLRDLIWANDVEGIRRLAPIAGPDYFIDGDPPLVYAIYSGHVEAAKALIDAGAYPKWRTAMGESLVYFAASENKLRMAAFLISVGAGTEEDAMRGGAQATTIEGITRGLEGLLKSQIEEDTGVRPTKTFREQWKDVEKLYKNNAGERDRSPDEPNAEADHGKETVAIRAEIQGIAAGDTLSIRSGPGMNYATIGKLQNGDEVTIEGPVVMNNETDWYPIRVKGEMGWARGKYLQRNDRKFPPDNSRE